MTQTTLSLFELAAACGADTSVQSVEETETELGQPALTLVGEHQQFSAAVQQYLTLPENLTAELGSQEVDGRPRAWAQVSEVVEVDSSTEPMDSPDIEPEVIEPTVVDADEPASDTEESDSGDSEIAQSDVDESESVDEVSDESRSAIVARAILTPDDHDSAEPADT